MCCHAAAFQQRQHIHIIVTNTTPPLAVCAVAHARGSVDQERDHAAWCVHTVGSKRCTVTRKDLENV